MKRLTVYSLAALTCSALMLGSCSNEETFAESDETAGSLKMHITGTRAETGGYDPFDYRTVRIYNDQGLIRKYTPQDEIPDVLQLLRGDYRIAVELGDRSEASFTRKTYRGEEPFVITPKETTQVEVPCSTINTAAEIRFDASIAENFGSDFAVVVCARNAFDAAGIADGSVPALTYSADNTGYFLPPEGVENLSWRFTGRHATKGDVELTGSIRQVKPGIKYTLDLRYSPDKPGYIDFSLTIREPDEIDDTILFSPDPSIRGVDFDMNEVQRYVSGGKTFVISSMGALQSVCVEAAGTVYDLLDPTVAGISSVRSDEFNLTVTLSDEFMALLPAGNTPLLFQITDADGGSLKSEVTFRKQGLVSAEYDAWACSLKLRAICFDDASEVTFRYRRAQKSGIETGDAWKTATAVAEEEEIRTATIEPRWEETTNEAGLPVYTLTQDTGISADAAYEYAVVIDGAESSVETLATAAAQTIPGGDMEDGSMNCFNNNHGTFWDSGNNSLSSPLCQQATFAGITGQYCARLAANKPAALVNLAAGNLFTGSFQQSIPNGIVSFGQPYTWTARPRAMHVLYYAEKLGAVNQNQHSGPLANGEQDKARIYVAIVDWDSPHKVTSGRNAPSGIWDPATQTSTDEGRIIGYGSIAIDRQSEGGTMIPVDLQMHYYDKTAKPSGKLTLVISCATSAYGDYMNGCTSNVLYVDDFGWVY